MEDLVAPQSTDSHTTVGLRDESVPRTVIEGVCKQSAMQLAPSSDITLVNGTKLDRDMDKEKEAPETFLQFPLHYKEHAITKDSNGLRALSNLHSNPFPALSSMSQFDSSRAQRGRFVQRIHRENDALEATAFIARTYFPHLFARTTITTSTAQQQESSSTTNLDPFPSKADERMGSNIHASIENQSTIGQSNSDRSGASNVSPFPSFTSSLLFSSSAWRNNSLNYDLLRTQMKKIVYIQQQLMSFIEETENRDRLINGDSKDAAEEEKRLAVRDSPVRQRPDRTPKPPVEGTYQPSPPRATISNAVLNALSAHPSFQLLQSAHAKFWSVLTQEMDKLQQFISQPIHKQCTMDIFAEFEASANGRPGSQQDKSEIPMEATGGNQPSYSRTCLCGCGTSYKHVFELLLEEMVQHGYSGSLHEKLNLAGIGEVALCQHAKLHIQRFMCALFHLDQMRRYLIHNYVIYQRVLDQYPHYTANTLLDQYHQRLFSMNNHNTGSEGAANDRNSESSSTSQTSSIPFVSIQAFHLQQFLQRTSPFTPIRTFLEYMLQAERVSMECIERGTRFESNQSLYMHEPSNCALCHSGTISCSIQLPCCHIACFGCLVVQASFGIRCPLKYCLREIPSNVELVAKISMEEWLNQAKKRKQPALSAGPQAVSQEMNKSAGLQQQSQVLQQQQQVESQRKMYESRLHHQQQVLGPNLKGAIANLLLQEDQKISPGTISNFSEGDESNFTQASVMPVDHLYPGQLPLHSQTVSYASPPVTVPTSTAVKIPSSHQEQLHVRHMNELVSYSGDDDPFGGASQQSCEAVDANGAPVSLLKHQPARRGGSGYSCHSCKTTKEPSSLYFCSQIITRGKHARMCKKKYCACCLKRLYPAEFVPAPETDFVCPSCKGACVCSSCTTAYRKQSADSASAVSNSMSGDNLNMEDPANIAPYAEVETPLTNVTARSLDSGLVVLNSSTSPLPPGDVDMNLGLGLQGAKVDLSLSEPIDPSTNPPRPLYSTARGQNKARTNKLRANSRLLKQPRAIRLPNKQMRANHVTARSMGEGVEFATAVPIHLRASNAPIAAVTFDENGVVNANSAPFIVRSTPPSARHLLRRNFEEMSPLSGYQSFSEQSSPGFEAGSQSLYGGPHLRKPSMVRRASAGEVLSQPSSRVSSRLQSPLPFLQQQQHQNMMASGNSHGPINARNLNQESCEWQQDPLLMMEQQQQVRGNGYDDGSQPDRYLQNQAQNQANSPMFSSHSVSPMSMPRNARMFTFSSNSSSAYLNSKSASASSSPHMPTMHHPPQEMGISRTLSPALSSDVVTANQSHFNPRHMSRASWGDSRSYRASLVPTSANVATAAASSHGGNLDLSNMTLTELQHMNDKLTKAMQQLQAEEQVQPRDRPQPRMATVASFEPNPSIDSSKHYHASIQRAYQPINSHVNPQQFPRQPQQHVRNHLPNQSYPTMAESVTAVGPAHQTESDLSLPALPLSAQPPLRKQESWNDTVEQLSHSLVNQSEAQLFSPPPIGSSTEPSSQQQQQSGALALLSRSTSEAMVDAANNGLSYSLQAPPRHFSPPQAVTSLQPLVSPPHPQHSLHVPATFDAMNPAAHSQSKIPESTLLSPLDVPLMSPQEFDQLVSPSYNTRPNANQMQSHSGSLSQPVTRPIQPAAMQAQPMSLPTPSDTNMIRLESTSASGAGAASNAMAGGMCLSLLTPLDTSMATHADPHPSPLWPAVANTPSSNVFMDRQRSFQDSLSQPFMADANAI